jgi:hypothetical protein
LFLPCIIVLVFFLSRSPTSLSLPHSLFYSLHTSPIYLSISYTIFQFVSTKITYTSKTIVYLFSRFQSLINKLKLNYQDKMSSRRSRSRQTSSSRNITDDQIHDLVSKLQQLLPEIRNRSSDKVCS